MLGVGCVCVTKTVCSLSPTGSFPYTRVLREFFCFEDIVPWWVLACSVSVSLAVVGARWVLLEVEAGEHTCPELRLEHFQPMARNGDECAYSPLRRHMYLFLLGLGGLRSHIWVSSGVVPMSSAWPLAWRGLTSADSREVGSCHPPWLSPRRSWAWRALGGHLTMHSSLQEVSWVTSLGVYVLLNYFQGWEKRESQKAFGCLGWHLLLRDLSAFILA